MSAVGYPALLWQPGHPAGSVCFPSDLLRLGASNLWLLKT